MKKILINLSFIIFCLSIIYCANTTKVKRPNEAYRYSTKSTIPKIQTKVYHFDTDSTTIYINIETEHLKKDSSAFITLTSTVKLLNINNLPKDSIINIFQIDRNKKQAVLTQNIALKEGETSQLDLIILENTSKRQFKKSILVDKSNRLNQQNFRLTNNETNALVFTNYAPQGSTLHVDYWCKNEKLTVHHYPPSQKLALPPFVMQGKGELYKTDTTFTITDNLNLNKKGLYYIKAKNSIDLGIAILSVGKDFPRLTKAVDLLKPLRYITKSKEYNKLLKAGNAKKAVDDFWLERAGSYKRGRVLIEKFYGRIQRSNAFFTSYKEGWKTDKGLIYIIYGTPQVVTHQNNIEYWTYAATRYSPQLRFSFQRQAIGFSPDRAVLQRNFYFEDSWHRAVFEWRKGIIQNLN